MALDREEVNRQLAILETQLQEIERARTYLRRGRKRLNESWSADEVRYFNQTIDTLDRNCVRARSQIEQLKKDILTAADEIAMEEVVMAADISGGVGYGED